MQDNRLPKVRKTEKKETFIALVNRKQQEKIYYHTQSRHYIKGSFSIFLRSYN